jgi:hypothetical protein
MSCGGWGFGKAFTTESQGRRENETIEKSKSTTWMQSSLERIKDLWVLCLCREMLPASPFSGGWGFGKAFTTESQGKRNNWRV